MQTVTAITRIVRQRHFFIAVALFVFLTPMSGQVSERIVQVTTTPFQPGSPLTLRIEFSNTVGIDHIDLAYRTFGQQTFKHLEMPLVASAASATIQPADLNPPFLEYYVTLYGSGETVLETHPLTNPELQPLRVDLPAAIPSSNEIIILSPEPAERVRPDDVLISISLSRFDSSANRSGTKIFLDEKDLSELAIVSDDLVIVSPANVSPELRPGDHVIRVEVFDHDGKSLASTDWTFTIRGLGAQLIGSTAEWRYRSKVQLETRNENITSSSSSYNRASLSATGTNGEFKILGSLYATNEENDRRQPQNRFFIGAESPWLRLGFGDTHPSFPDLIMNGKRVRGFSGALTVGPFSLNLVKGDIIRRIESDVLKTFSSDSLVAEQQRDSSGYFTEYDASTNPPTWAKLAPGTFDRDLFILRPVFGTQDNRFGLSYLHSKDDISSIRRGSKPQENAVAGTDLLLSFDDKNIQISGQAAFSFSNRDITSGTLTDADLDSIFSDATYDETSRRDIERARDWFSRFITVNENLKPLSLKNTATLAYEGSLALNYYDNAFRLTVLRRGESYESFGQSYIRTDVAGFTVSDRWRASNQVILTGGFEQLKDNTAKTKATTTTFLTGNIAMTYISLSDLPTITVAYVLASNNNRLPLTSSYAIDDKTHRVLFQLGRQFTYSGRHNATLGVSVSNRNDKTARNLDTKNTSISLGVLSTYDLPLQTTFSTTINSSRFSAPVSPTGSTLIKLNYVTMSAGAQYRMAEERLRLNGTLSPTFGDIKRTLVDAGAQYFFRKDLSLQSQLSLYVNGGVNSTNDVIWSFILRFDI